MAATGERREQTTAGPMGDVTAPRIHCHCQGLPFTGEPEMQDYMCGLNQTRLKKGKYTDIFYIGYVG